MYLCQITLDLAPLKPIVPLVEKQVLVDKSGQVMVEQVGDGVLEIIQTIITVPRLQSNGEYSSNSANT